MNVKTKNATTKLCVIAVSAALFFLLAKITLKIGNFRILDFASLPIGLLAMIYGGPIEAMSAAFLGEFLSQILGQYGLTVTTPLWILPPVFRALCLGLFAYKYRNDGLYKKPIMCYVAFIVAAICTTIINTGVSWLDSKIFNYSYLIVVGETITRFITGIITAVVIASVVMVITPAIKKAVRSTV